MIFGLVYYTLGLFALIGIYPAFRYANAVIARLFTKKASVPVTVVVFFAVAALFYEVHSGVFGIIGWAIKIAFVAFGVFKLYPLAKGLKEHTDEGVAKIENWHRKSADPSKTTTK
jgi:hypothetical protein